MILFKLKRPTFCWSPIEFLLKVVSPTVVGDLQIRSYARPQYYYCFSPL